MNEATTTLTRAALAFPSGVPSCNYDSSLTMVRRVCSSTDCAIIIDSDVGVMVAAGYTSQNTPLGCAIKNSDSDADEIPDGFETILGMNSLSNDSDGDGCNDLIEYPYAEMQTSDPMISGDCP